MTKFTKRQKFEALIATMRGEATEIDRATLVEFCEGEIGALDARSAKAKAKAAEKKAEADAIMEATQTALTGEAQTIADITKVVVETVEDATFHKVSSRLTKLVDAGVAVREEIKIPGGEGVKARTVKAFKLAD
jgi:hypothetical protein